MLKEIRSDVFKNTDGVRPTIIFHKGLNVINGSETGSNSIGKSTFLMAIDFCFGGKDYYEKLKNVIKNVNHHEINFAFQFENQMYYFSRDTSNPDIITLCDSDYNKRNETWSKEEFLNWLNKKYSNPTSLSFRNLVSLYFRIYNRENLSEQLPLRSFNNETEGQSIERLLKLFDLYGPITQPSIESKASTDKKSAFTEAQKYEYIPKIQKKKYEENLKRIEELEKQKSELAEKSEKGLLDLSSSQADLLRDLHKELSIYKRQRGKLFSQLDILKKDKIDNKVSLSSDFEELKKFFPTLDTNKLIEVEEFHKEISGIMDNQIKVSEKKVWNLINLLNDKISDIESQISNISQIKHVSTVTLQKYSSIDKEIDSLKLENEKYSLLCYLTADCKEKEKTLTDETMKQAAILENSIQSKMHEINHKIFETSDNEPIFHIKSPKSYEFYTPDDDGTGTNYKGMIVMDLSTLELTSLPVLIHDSVCLKHISNESIEKIFQIYDNENKQIFVSIDKDTSYTPDTIQIIRRNEVLKLSSGGNELFGFHFGKNGGNK